MNPSLVENGSLQESRYGGVVDPPDDLRIAQHHSNDVHMISLAAMHVNAACAWRSDS